MRAGIEGREKVQLLGDKGSFLEKLAELDDIHPQLLMSNPVRHFRHAQNLSLHQVAALSQVNYQTWYLTERGCYATVPQAIVDFLEDKYGYSSSYIQREYLEFVAEVRHYFKRRYIFRYNFLEGVTSLEDLIDRLHIESRSQFAKLLAVQPAVLYKYVSGKQKKLPQQLVDALLEVGISEDVISGIKD